MIDDKNNLFIEIDNILNEIKNKLQTINNLPNFESVLLKIYCRIYLTMKEIHLLTSNGYLEGAFALSRRTYEGLIILEFFIQNKSDSSLIEKYTDASVISGIEINITRLTWAIEQFKNAGKNKEKFEKSLTKHEANYEKYKNKYSKASFKRDYWWAGKNSFAELMTSVGYKKDHMYKFASSKVHLNAFDTFLYVDNLELGILIDKTYDGIGIPLWYELLNLAVSTQLINNIVVVSFDSEIEKMINLIDIANKV